MESSTIEGTAAISQMHFVTAKATGEEYGELCDSAEVDLDIGDTNDFKIVIAVSDSDTEHMGYGCRIFAPGTEYGELLETSNLYPVHEKLHCVEEHGEECWSTR